MPAAALAAALAGPACLSVLNGVAYDPAADAPTVLPRPGGCSVEIVEDGSVPARPHALLGRVRLDWTRAKMEAQGHQGALKSLREEACARGAHLILDLRVLPQTPNPGSFYDAAFAVLLDDDGQPLQPRSLAPDATTPSTTAPSPQATAP